MRRKKVLVLGSNFGGLTAALAVKHELHGDVDVTVVSPAEHFLFNPSLIWLPFGKRAPQDITFPVEPTFERARHRVRPRRATGIDPDRKRVDHRRRDARLRLPRHRHRLPQRVDVVPGLGRERGHHHHARRTRSSAGEAWRRSWTTPATSSSARPRARAASARPTSSSSTPSYQLRKAGLSSRCKLTTSPPSRSSGTSASAACRTARRCWACSCEGAHRGAHRVAMDHVDPDAAACSPTAPRSRSGTR